MTEDDWLALRFEEQRGRLTALARRMLGSAGEAEDAVQEAWIRLSRSDAAAIENLGAWLTTVLSRVCLNMLQARRARPEVDLEAVPEVPAEGVDPEQQAVLADTVGLALLVVLDTLSPSERVAFVLHDLFAVPFEQIAPILGRNEPATRKLASRARRRIQGERAEPDRVRQAKLVDAFLAAARDGEFEALLALLDDDVVLHADATSVSLGATDGLRGALPVAEFSRHARGATPALLDGAAAVVWVVDDRPRVVYRFATSGDRITEIELIGDAEAIAELDLVIAE
jgi:RNA polymerase sigma-70 factor (ECF subfamily)